MKARHDRERNQSQRPQSAHITSKDDEEKESSTTQMEEKDETVGNDEEIITIDSPWDCLLVETALTARVKNCSNDWVLDSGCTHHMCYNPDLFITELTPMHEEVFLGYGKSLKIEGIGSVQINTINTRGNVQPIILRNCFYVPKLTRNLISISQIANDKIHIDFNTDSNKVILSKDGVQVYAYK
jgi:hypothetical protein